MFSFDVSTVFSNLPVSGVPLIACVAIYFFSAVLSGLSGFGFSALGALSMCFLPPQFAISLLMTVSLVTQMYSLRAMLAAAPVSAEKTLKPATLLKQMMPYALGGVAGLYVGIQLLGLLSPTAICVILGVFLVVYATYCLYKPASLRLEAGASPHWSGVVGFFSTMIGAFCGGPGIVMMAWLQLRAVPKDIARGVAQPFIIFMQIIGLAILVLQSPSIFSVGFFVSVALLLPMALIGSEIGVKIYAKTSEFNYRKIVMFLLLGSGAALSLKAALG